jgi:acyl-coenzyme A synthetase/AMP-(fatty) acid ligase
MHIIYLLQIPPTELEHLIMSHPEVRDVAVVGVQLASTKKYDHVLRAFVVPVGGAAAALSPGSIYDHIKGRVSKYGQLEGGIEFVDKIPRSAFGQIQREGLKKGFQAKQMKS